jgi:predicted AlkP superfamily pyrophosphatase or phosphodiesterase
MIGKRRIGAVAGALLLAAASMAPRAYCGGIPNKNGIRHVLLISIDGMHVLDFPNCKAGSYCPNLKALGTTGVNYLDTSASKPSDSFPGLMSIVSGGSPRTMGINHDGYQL